MKLASKSDEEILAMANPIMDNLMQGFAEINHEKHTRDFTERMKAIVTQEYLQAVCQHYQAEWGHLWSSYGSNGAHSKQGSSWLRWFWLGGIQNTQLIMSWCTKPTASFDESKPDKAGYLYR